MICRNNQTKSLIIILICFFMIISITLPVVAQEGKQSGEGGENTGEGNNSPDPEPNQPNESSGSGNQQGKGKQGEGGSGPNNGQQHNQNQGNGSQNGCDQKQNRYQNRKMNHAGGQRQYRVRSQWNLNNSTDAFEINFASDPEPSLKLEYMPSSNESNIQLKFKIILKEIVEFEDGNNNSRYDPTDVIVSKYDFNSVDFTNLTYNNETLSSGESIVRAETHTVDNVFTMNMVISDNFTTCYKQLITPSEMKIDFIIQHYPYVENTTQLALLLEIITDHDLGIESESFDEKNGFASNESAINISSMNYSGFFSWLNTAIVDGVNQSVQATIFKEENIGSNGPELTNYIALSYPRGTQIIHDPKIGVVSQSFAPLSITDIALTELGIGINVIITYILSCAIAIILFLGIITLRRRI